MPPPWNGRAAAWRGRFWSGIRKPICAPPRAAGVRVSLVGFGPLGAGIAELKPDHVLDHFDALPELAARWLG